MTNFIQNVLQISITMAAVIGVLLLLVPVWQRRYSARWRKAIWFIIAVRLLVPFSIELPSAPVQMNVDLHETVMLSSQSVPMDTTPVPAIPSQIEIPDNVTINTTVNNVAPTITTEEALVLDRGTVLFALWLIGILAFILYHAMQYRRFYGKIMASAKPLDDSDELLERAGAGMGLMHYPNVLISGGVQSPMLIGFRKPTIVLPYKLYGENELVMILRHELTHYKHHDLWYKLILLCANALHWFNPLVWLMNRQAGRDVEQVCDDYVVDGMDIEYRKAYSMTILNTMASQKGVALSTHLSKDAQNTKKRFAGILQPKTYKKGIAVFAVVLILAVGISGCLQVGKIDEGVALYNRVAEYLPDNAIHNPEVYEIEEYSETGMTKYHWTEEQVYLPDRIYEAYSEAGPDNERHSYQWGYSAPEYYIYEQEGSQKIFRYKRELSIVVDNGEVAHFEYWNKEIEDNYTGVFHGMDNQKALAYIETVTDTFIPKEERVVIQRDSRYAMASGRQSYMVYGKLNDYAINLMLDGGYVQGFSRMPNKVYRQQVIDWLATEQTRLHRNYYNVLGNETTIFNEEVDGNYYVVTLMHTMRHKNDGNPDDVPYIQALKASNPAEYQQHYDDYNKERIGNTFLKIKAEIRENGTLDMENAVIYSDVGANETKWEKIEGLHTFVYDGKPEPNWSADKTMALSTAYSYISALQNEFLRFTGKDDLCVRFAGEIANGNEEYTRDYQAILQMLGPENWATLYRNYAYTKTDEQTILEQLLYSMQSKYALIEDFETAEQLVLEAQLIPENGGVDYITLTLKDIDEQWTVVDVQFHCVR